MSTYLVGTDGSDSAAKAVARAVELAAATDGKVYVLCAYEVGGAALDTPSDAASSAAQRIVDDEVEELRRRGIHAEGVVAQGKPAALLLEEARRLSATVIVVGNRRMQGLGRLLGSVANEVAHHAPCDVLIVKTM